MSDAGLGRRGLGGRDDRSIWFGRRDVDGVLFPLVLLCLGSLARMALEDVIRVAVLKVAVPVLVALVVIRVGVKVLQAAFAQAAWARLVEHTLSWLAWLVTVLWVTGLLPVLLAEMEAIRWTVGGSVVNLRDLIEGIISAVLVLILSLSLSSVSGLLPGVLNELDQITWKMGASTLSVRTLLEGLLTASAVLILTLWISSAIETRLLRSATGGELSLRKAVSNATRALLMFVGLMLALSSVGIGFGLQKLAANYISGFVILAERSMRIGDNVKVDGFEGTITAINARYTVVRSPQGRESIVPNELLITSRVENLSLADSNLHQTTVVSVAYDADVDVVLLEEALSEPRVLRQPEPAVFLSNFGADGLEFTVGYWVMDLENSRLGVRSGVNLAILRALRSQHIEIPYPQRVIHSR